MARRGIAFAFLIGLFLAPLPEAQAQTTYELWYDAAAPSVGVDGIVNVLAAGGTTYDYTAPGSTNQYRSPLATGVTLNANNVQNRLRHNANNWTGTTEVVRAYSPALTAANNAVAASATGRVDLYMRRAGSGTGTCTLELYEYNGTTGVVGAVKGSATATYDETVTPGRTLNLTFNNAAFIAAVGNRLVVYFKLTTSAGGGGDPVILYASNFSAANQVGHSNVTFTMSAGTTTTIGNYSSEPASATVAPGSGITDLDNFTLVTSSGTDTINSVTVTLGPAGAFNNIDTLSITNAAGTTTYGTTTVPLASNTVAIALTTNITATTTATQYRVRITPKTHAAMPVVPGASYATTGTVTTVLHSATNTLVYSDTTSGTITIDNASPAAPTGFAGSLSGADVSLSWTNPAVADFSEVVLVRKAGSAVGGGVVPVEGTTYVAGNTLSDGLSTVIYAGSGTSFLDAGPFANGTTYYYAIFAKDTHANYSSTAATTSAAPTANLAITNGVWPQWVLIGNSSTFYVSVTNSGPWNATTVQTTVSVPAGLTYVSASPSQGTCNFVSPTLTCAFGTVAKGATATVQVAFTGASEGTYTSTATVAATETDTNTADNSANAAVEVADQTRVADLTLAKTATASVTIGANITYSLTIHNNGSASAAAAVVSDPLPAGTTYVSATPSQGSCSGTAIVSCNLGAIANGADATVQIVATNNTSGTKANTATVTNTSPIGYDPNLTNNVATATTTVTGGAAPFCVQAGKDGAGGTLSTVVNTYYAGIANVTQNTANTCIFTDVSTGAATAVAADDLLLVIQMQDATVNWSNTVDYGDGPNPPGVYNGAGATSVNAGRYEFVKAVGARGTSPSGYVCGTTGIPVTGGGTNNGTINSYVNADATNTAPASGQKRFQVVRVPQYTTATLNGATAAPWVTTTTGTIGLGTGGIFAIDVQGALTLTGTAVSVDGLGFRGGAARQLAGGTGTSTDLRTLSTNAANGSKGEGNAGTPEWVHTGVAVQTNQPADGYPNGSMGRGAPGNAGGGSTDGNPPANDQNSGGGGGSNGGAGGKGGYSWSTGLDCGGLGASVTPAITQLVLGGGGGAGTRNNSSTVASAGTAGGGLIVLRAGSLIVNPGATLSANGLDAYQLTANDGGGGGGAGGSVIVTVNSGDMNGLTIQAHGGRGGDAWRNSTPPDVGTTAANRHGPGGGGGGGVVVYTNTAVPPTLDVAGGQAGYANMYTGNNFDHFGAMDGGVGQTLFAAPGLIPGAGSGSDCSPDLSIDLMHQETTVTPGGTATFLATVTNAGPFVSTTSGVETKVIITFDPWLTPTAASGTGWSCGIAAQVVTCTRTDVLAAEFSYPPISIETNVLAGAPDSLSNTATVANGGDFNTANNTDVDPVGVRAPTQAVVREFEAVRVGGSVSLRWRTSFEANNLGFRIYREIDGVSELITPSVIAGCALTTGRHSHHVSGRRYSWVDQSPAEGAVYWLEDVDLDGTRSLTGPVSQTQAQTADIARGIAFEEASPLLSRLGRQGSQSGRHGTQSGVASQAAGSAAGALQVAGSLQITGAPLSAAVPAVSAVKLLVRQEGWYRVTRNELIAAGFDPGPRPSRLQLFTAGVEQSLLVNDGGDGVLDGSDAIEFYGIGIDSPYDNARVYRLVNGASPGLRIRTAKQPGRLPASPASFPFTVERKDRTVTFFELTTNGDNENFFGSPVTAEPTALEFALNHVDLAAPRASTLTVALQGVTTETQHEVDVLVNGLTVGTLSFPGQDYVVRSLNVPNSLLREGANEVGFVAKGLGEDVSVIDYVRITYPHFYALDDGALKMTVPGGTQATLGGLADRSLRIFDITIPGRPVALTPKFASAAGVSSAVVGVSGTVPATLFAFTPAIPLSVDGVVPDFPSNWRSANRAADLVVIAHPTLIAAVQPLVDLRRSQGLATAVVDVTDVYDEFSFGQRTPFALRDFLQYARSRWLKPPRFVMLVGDASFDPKDYLGQGNFDLVPTKFVPATYFKAASDDWLTDFDADGIPNLAIGRLPARTPAAAALMVAKILARDAALAPGGVLPDWAKSVLLVSDEYYEFDFEAAAATLPPLLPSDVSLQEVAVEQLGAAAPAAIVARINDGQLLVNYMGHGSVELWSRLGIFSDVEAAALANGERLPVFVLMTCLNGMFADLYTESLAEALLLAPDGGAAAVWASSGLTEPVVQTTMNQELFRQIFKLPSITLGEAVIRAKTAVSDPDVRRTWILFGDPSMHLR